MSLAANEARFLIQVADLDTPLSVESFRGTETIHDTFRFDVSVVCEESDLDLNALLHNTALITLRGNQKDRFVHGQITGAQQLDSGRRLTRYQLVIEPSLKLLDYRRNHRVFQNQSVPDIVARLLEEAGILSDRYDLQLNNHYEPRDYCVQYGESELNFIRRILAEEGIHFHFEHDHEKHMLVLADGQDGFPGPEEGEMALFNSGNGMYAAFDTITEFGVMHQVGVGQVDVRQYDFSQAGRTMEHSKQPLPVEVEGDSALVDYQYPGDYQDDASGKHQANTRLEQQRINTRQAKGKSNLPAICAGHYFDLTEHNIEEWNQFWLTTSITHQGEQPQVLEELAEGESRYENTFTATPWDKFWRPQRINKPSVDGLQSAKVTGPEGEEIHTDEFGRIKVQFHWDRHGKADGQTSCWVRVAQSWAGNGYGSFTLPRVGMEVLVSFINGDVDQPIVVGSGYNSQNLTPYAMPEHKTRTTLKTSSIPGGEGYNELRFEDKAGDEQIFIHAEKDMDTHIGNDLRQQVENDNHQLTGANTYNETGADTHQTTKGEQRQYVGKDLSQTVDGSLHLKTGAATLIESGQEVHLKAGSKIVLEAGAEITLSAGGSFIKIDPSGVSLVGAGINMNSGGSPGSGSGAQPQMPMLPIEADQSNAGELIEPKQAEPELDPLQLKALEALPPVNLSQQRQAIVDSAEENKGACDSCGDESQQEAQDD